MMVIIKNVPRKTFIKKVLKVSLAFFIGFLSCLFLLYLVDGDYMETPRGFGFSFDFGLSKAPSNWISEDKIIVLEDRVILNIKEASLSNYAPTGSMKPVLDFGANGIRIKPENEDDIQIGDIVSFKSENKLIVHRVVEKMKDEKGFYFITKGDNNNFADDKIRFKDIEYVTVGIIY